MADKQVNIKVVTDADTSEVEALEAKLRKIKNQKLRADIEADTTELENVNKRIESLKTFLNTVNTGNTNIHINDDEIKKAESELEKLESKQYDLKIDVETSKLQVAKNLEASLTSTQHVFVDADTNEVVSAQQLIKKLESTEQVFVNADTGEVVSAKELIDSLSDSEQVFVEVEDGDVRSAKELIESLTSTQQVKIEVDDGEVRSLKDELAGFAMGAMGFSEAKEGIESMVDAAASADQNLAFLKIGFDKAGSQNALEDAKAAQEKIQDIVKDAPGDDIAMNSILSTAVAKDINLTDEAIKGLGTSVADYFAGAEVNGKHAAEAIQDVRSYIASGNVAELETTGIFNDEQLDELKGIDDVSERVEKFNELMKETSYAGLSSEETLSNKFAELDGMIAKGQTDLGSLFTPAIGGALDFANNLNEITNGGFGMLLAAAQPVGGTLVGIAGTLSDISIIDKNWNIKENLGTVKQKALDLAGTLKDNLVGAWDTLKNTMSGVKNTVKDLGTKLLEAGRNALTAGYNALKSAGLWLYQKAGMVASAIATGIQTAATWAASAAQAALNFVMSMNPIMLLVIAIGLLIAALGYLYFNNEQVRAAIDGLGQTLMSIGQTIYGYVISAWNSLISTLQSVWGMIVSFAQNLTSTVMGAVNFVITSFMNGIAFMASLPGRIWSILSNIISKVISWGSSIASNFLSSASKAVSNFMSYISSLPGKLSSELQNMLSTVSDWAATLPQKFWDAGVNAVKNFLDALGIHSPGTMQTMMVWEVSEMARRVPVEGAKLVSSVSDLGSDIVSEFGDPTLSLGFDGVDNDQLSFDFEGTANSQLGKVADRLYGNTINLTIEVGSVDNEDRIQEIVDAVRRELAWNNKTAGRTV